jgi:chromosome partitioning protein
MRLLIHNQKGGVGKTTTAVNLGAALLREGLARRVVLIDIDPQMHLTAMLAPSATPADGTVADWLSGRPVNPVALPEEPGLFVVPGAQTLAEAVLPPSGATPDPGTWLVLDTAPGWSPLMAAVARWADRVICPTEPDFLGLSGVNRLLARMDAAGVPREAVRLLLCRFGPRLSLHAEVRERLADRFGQPMLLPVEIRASVKLAEAPGQARTIFGHAPRSTGADDYRALARIIACPPTLPIGRTAA